MGLIVIKFLCESSLDHGAPEGTGGAGLLRHDGVQAEGLPLSLVRLGGRGHPPAHLPHTGSAQVKNRFLGGQQVMNGRY